MISSSHRQSMTKFRNGTSLWLSALSIALLLATSCPAAPGALQMAAEQGDTKAQYEFALSLLQNQGQQPNYAEAFKWFRLAAEKGHAPAQYSLALRYLFGQGVSKNDQTAVHWLQQAAEQGFADAQFSLGLRYYWGQGVTKNFALAEQWFDKALQQGQPKAAKFLTELQARPTSPRPDALQQPTSTQLIEDYAEASLAAEAGSPTAAATKQQLDEIMTASEIMQAIQLAARKNRQKPVPQEISQQLADRSPQLNTAEDFFHEGNQLVQTGQLQLAIAAYEKSLAITPDNASSYRNLASAYAHAGNNRQAIVNLKRSIDLSPGQASKHATLGMLYQADKNASAALAEYRTAARLNPAIGWIYPDMAAIFIQQQNYPDAWKAVRQAELLGHAKTRISDQLTRLAPDAKSSQLGLQQAGMQLRQLVLTTHQEAEAALLELKNGRDFSLIAKKNSLKPFNRNGGYWGPYLPEQLAPQFSTVLRDLPPLVFSPAIETEAGFHILQKFPFFADLLAER